jgi:hypothetical protein
VAATFEASAMVELRGYAGESRILTCTVQLGGFSSMVQLRGYAGESRILSCTVQLGGFSSCWGTSDGVPSLCLLELFGDFSLYDFYMTFASLYCFNNK